MISESETSAILSRTYFARIFEIALIVNMNLHVNFHSIQRSEGAGANLARERLGVCVLMATQLYTSLEGLWAEWALEVLG